MAVIETCTIIGFEGFGQFAVEIFSAQSTNEPSSVLYFRCLKTGHNNTTLENVFILILLYTSCVLLTLTMLLRAKM